MSEMTLYDIRIFTTRKFVSMVLEFSLSLTLIGNLFVSKA